MQHLEPFLVYCLALSSYVHIASGKHISGSVKMDHSKTLALMLTTFSIDWHAPKQLGGHVPSALTIPSPLDTAFAAPRLQKRHSRVSMQLTAAKISTEGLVQQTKHSQHDGEVVTKASLPLSSATDDLQMHLLTMSPELLCDHYGWPKRSGKVDIVWRALREGMNALDEEELRLVKDFPAPAVAAVPKLLQQLHEDCAPVDRSASLSHLSTAADGTTKLLIRLADGLSVETVIIPMSTGMSGQHTTLCVSSQVGCNRACAFCRTGKMGLVRSLTAEEILVQVWFALRVAREKGIQFKPDSDNIVFMGMGEPLNNFDAVRTAVDMLVHPRAFAFLPRRVSVSTVGPSPDLIAKAALLPCTLAWSVHAVDDTLRKLLVPTTRHSMVELRDSVIRTLEEKAGGKKTRRLMVELTLMAGINDQIEHAEQLATFLRPFGRTEVVVNLIPYNENGLTLNGELIKTSPTSNVRAYQLKLWELGVICWIRTTRGDDTSAACGQLATASKRSQLSRARQA
jgi:23S rRNA (adenine2503-C2)-methyltransferase